MTPLLSSIRKHSCAAVLLAGAALAGLSVPSAEAKMPNVRRTSSATISFALTAIDTTSTAAGTASIKLSEGRRSTSAELNLNVTGLAAGSYVVDATLEDASVVELGRFHRSHPARYTDHYDER